MTDLLFATSVWLKKKAGAVVFAGFSPQWGNLNQKH